MFTLGSLRSLEIRSSELLWHCTGSRDATLPSRDRLFALVFSEPVQKSAKNFTGAHRVPDRAHHPDIRSTLQTNSRGSSAVFHWRGKESWRCPHLVFTLPAVRVKAWRVNQDGKKREERREEMGKNKLGCKLGVRREERCEHRHEMAVKESLWPTSRVCTPHNSGKIVIFFYSKQFFFFTRIVRNKNWTKILSCLHARLANQLWSSKGTVVTATFDD